MSEHDEPTNEQPNYTAPDVALEGGTTFSYTINGWPVSNPTVLNPGGPALHSSYYWNTNAAANSWMYPAYVPPTMYQSSPAPESLTPERIEELMSKQRIQSAPSPDTLTEERIRQIVAEAIHKALYPEQDGLVSPHTHRRVEMHEEDGSTWRGLLRRVEKESEM